MIIGVSLEAVGLIWMSAGVNPVTCLFMGSSSVNSVLIGLHKSWSLHRGLLIAVYSRNSCLSMWASFRLLPA